MHTQRLIVIIYLKIYIIYKFELNCIMNNSLCLSRVQHHHFLCRSDLHHIKALPLATFVQFISVTIAAERKWHWVGVCMHVSIPFIPQWVDSTHIKVILWSVLFTINTFYNPTRSITKHRTNLHYDKSIKVSKEPKHKRGVAYIRSLSADAICRISWLLWCVICRWMPIIGSEDLLFTFSVIIPIIQQIIDPNNNLKN